MVEDESIPNYAVMDLFSRGFSVSSRWRLAGRERANPHMSQNVHSTCYPISLMTLRIPPAMAYQIEYAAEADAPALAHINTLSFQHRGFLGNVFPEASQPALEGYKSVYTMKHLANPQMHVLQIADPASGEVVGYGRWLIPESLGFGTSMPVLSEPALVGARDPTALAPRPMNESLYAAFRGLLEESRRKHATDRDMSRSLRLCIEHSRTDEISARPAGDIA